MLTFHRHTHMTHPEVGEISMCTRFGKVLHMHFKTWDYGDNWVEVPPEKAAAIQAATSIEEVKAILAAKIEPEDLGSITCPQCGAESFHPDDIENMYCSRCHMYYDEMRV